MPVTSSRSIRRFALRSIVVTVALLTVLVAVVAIDHLNEASFLDVVWTLCGLAVAAVVVRSVNDR